MPHVTIRSGPRAGERIDIEGEVTLGRQGTDVVIGDDEMSRRHAALRPRDGGGLEVEDLGSTNGTYVDGERISVPTPLRDGSVVRVGTTELAAHVEAPMRSQETRLADVQGDGGGVEGGTVVGRAVPGGGHAAPPAAPAPPAREPAAVAAAAAPTPAAAPPSPAAAPPAFAVAGAPAFQSAPRRRRGAATRSLPATLLVSAIIVGDAVALGLYFYYR